MSRLIMPDQYIKLPDGGIAWKPDLMQTKLEKMFSPTITLIQDYTGRWQPDCGATADRLHDMGIDFGPDGISTLALDDILYNVSQYGYCLETVPLNETED